MLRERGTSESLPGLTWFCRKSRSTSKVLPSIPHTPGSQSFNQHPRSVQNVWIKSNSDGKWRSGIGRSASRSSKIGTVATRAATGRQGVCRPT